jgi:hypothetical protein
MCAMMKSALLALIKGAAFSAVDFPQSFQKPVRPFAHQTLNIRSGWKIFFLPGCL